MIYDRSGPLAPEANLVLYKSATRTAWFLICHLLSSLMLMPSLSDVITVVRMDLDVILPISMWTALV